MRANKKVRCSLCHRMNYLYNDDKQFICNKCLEINQIKEEPPIMIPKHEYNFLMGYCNASKSI